MLPEMGHSNTTEASRSYLYKNDVFFFLLVFFFVFVFFSVFGQLGLCED